MSASIEFAWPLALALLLLAPAFVWFERARDRIAAHRRDAILGPRAAALAPLPDARARRVQRTLAALALAAAVLALAGPRWGEPESLPEVRGLDLVVCLDVSRSMRARDVAPSRLEAARVAVQTLAERARGDRLGLVAFAGSARLRVPLTTDTASFVQLLHSTDELAVTRGGTDLGAAIDTALSALVGGDDGGVVLLLTDGEDHGERGLQAARRCRAQGVVVHCLGFGSERGGKIPVDTGSGEAFLRDRTGADVVSALDRSALAALAAAAGGEFAAASEVGARGLVELYERRIEPEARAALATGGERAPAERFQWPLLLAVLLWLAQWIRWRSPR